LRRLVIVRRGLTDLDEATVACHPVEAQPVSQPLKVAQLSRTGDYTNDPLEAVELSILREDLVHLLPDLLTA
jgi:hypothetical protein